MQRINVLALVLVICFASALKAQAPAPKPDPELKKLHVLVGHWTYQGENKAGPLGPGGKFTGEYTGQMILGGFFFQDQSTEKGAMGEMRSLGIYAYDPANKSFVCSSYLSNGSTFSGTLTISGNTLTWAGKIFVAGKQYLLREPFTLASDLRSGTAKGEISVDGHTWTPFLEAKYTKAKPAAKK